MWSAPRFTGTHLRLPYMTRLEATRRQINGPADAASSYRLAPMAEHLEGDSSVEQLVSVLTKSVTTDGHTRRYTWLLTKSHRTQLTKQL